jgi:hypothetical protein
MQETLTHFVREALLTGLMGRLLPIERRLLGV